MLCIIWVLPAGNIMSRFSGSRFKVTRGTCDGKMKQLLLRFLFAVTCYSISLPFLVPFAK